MKTDERRPVDELTIRRAANGFVVFDERCRGDMGVRTDFANGSYVATTPDDLAGLVRRLVSEGAP